MSSIVLELQRDALSPSVRISDLLRKALVVAKKLGVGEFEKWIEQELNGYRNRQKVPDYRRLSGRVKAWNPYRGWVPVFFEDTVLAEAVSQTHSSQSVAGLEELLEGEGSMLGLPFPQDFALQLADACGHRPTEIILQVQRASIREILDSVRTVVLNWALKLEQDGILGEGLAFTQKERDAAARVTYNVNNFFGPIGQSQVQQDSSSATQLIMARDVDQAKLREFLSLLEQRLPDLSLEGATASELKADLKTIQGQVESPKPKSSVVRACLASIKSILEGTAGNVAAQLLAELCKVIG